MGEQTKIEWTDHTFNPWWGCARVSPACDHCYAAAWAKRTGESRLWEGERRRTGASNWRQPIKWNAAGWWECHDCGFRGTTREIGDTPSPPETKPCQHSNAKKARRRVFCASMADVFDNVVPEQWRADLFHLIRMTPNLDWLLLTKRIGSVRRMISDSADWHFDHGDRDTTGWLTDWYKHKLPPANVWLGATVVNQDEADRDIPKLLATPARIRFLSIEPMLGPIDIKRYLIGHEDAGTPMDGAGSVGGCRAWTPQIDWVIVGGESGAGARPMHPQWARGIRDQCAVAGVPFLFKQFGDWWPISQMPDGWLDQEQTAKFRSRRTVLQLDGTQKDAFPIGAMTCFKVGKVLAGRLLDGHTHDGFPS